MYDNSLYFADIAMEKSDVLERYNLTAGNFILATIHRDNNTDDPARLNSIFKALVEIASQYEIDIVLPLHPRTSKMLGINLEKELFETVKNYDRIKLVPPASFFEIIALEQNCKLVMTDSGGVQKEAYYFKKPVIILRPETEWVEIVENGTGIITDANTQNILDAYTSLADKVDLEYPPVFGDGNAGAFICQTILEA